MFSIEKASELFILLPFLLRYEMVFMNGRCINVCISRVAIQNIRRTLVTLTILGRSSLSPQNANKEKKSEYVRASTAEPRMCTQLLEYVRHSADGSRRVSRQFP